MLGGKGSYSRSVKIEKHLAKKNKRLRNMLKSAKKRYNKYKDKMRVVDMDALVKKYAENGLPYFEGYKIKFHKNESDYVLIADPSGYVRVLDLKTRTYVDVIKGETLKGDEKDYQERTHFRIKRRDE